MIVVDTTILIYSVGGEHPLAGPCRGLVTAVGDGAVRATTTVEVLQEFAQLRARRRDRRDAVVLTRRFATLLAPLVATESTDLDRGLDLFTAHPRLGSFDAVLAACAIRRDAAIASTDAAFDAVPGLVHLDPGADDLVERAQAWS